MVRVVSLGAGVQSTAMLLMAQAGAFGDVPDLAVFADTGWEGAATYRHLDWLETVSTIPIERASAGNLRDAALARRTPAGQGGKVWDFTVLPFYLRGLDGQNSMLRRQCTNEYKLRPLRRRLRPLARPGQPVELWMGISLDEAAYRMRDSGVQYLRNRYPLVERGLSRHDCLLWLERHGYPRPPRSACLGCPFKRDDEWRQLRDTDPIGWEDAVTFDATIRAAGLPRIDGDVYLHRSMRPLAEADLSTPEERGQLALPWGDECTGICGT